MKETFHSENIYKRGEKYEYGKIDICNFRI